MEDGTLYIVATPIGNLGDLSVRARDILANVTAIGAEDTRVTGKLLSALDIDGKLVSIQEHSTERDVANFVAKLENGDLAYVSDAGTPAISDPGFKLVVAAREAGYEVRSLPGASSVTSALSISGFPANTFFFAGFPPQKKGRKSFFESLASRPETLVLFESKHRIEKTLSELPQDRKLFLARELTKLHETHYTGTAPDVLKALSETSSKGEYVIIIAPINWN